MKLLVGQGSNIGTFTKLNEAIKVMACNLHYILRSYAVVFGDFGLINLPEGIPGVNEQILSVRQRYDKTIN